MDEGTIHKLSKAPAKVATLAGPLGPILLAANSQGLIRLAIGRRETDFRADLEGQGSEILNGSNPHLEEALQEIREYLAGTRRAFRVSVDWTDMGPFQRLVLQAAAEVPFGSLVTYHQLAETINRPKAARAVGNALARNPIPIVVPCHRVVRSDGVLGGYSGGAHVKEWLLALEGAPTSSPNAADGRRQPKFDVLSRPGAVVSYPVEIRG